MLHLVSPPADNWQHLFDWLRSAPNVARQEVSSRYRELTFARPLCTCETQYNELLALAERHGYHAPTSAAHAA